MKKTLIKNKFSYVDGFWKKRHELNIHKALLYQWDMYEIKGTINNFRIAGEIKKGNRQGFFYTDSDLHKWADAASRSIKFETKHELESKLDEYINVMEAAQEDDGYLFTFNQIHFPGTRWKNLMIEHELYCMGHFIEAGVEHFCSTGKKQLLDLAVKTADCITNQFLGAKSKDTSGHQEIEIALIKLYNITGDKRYFNGAGEFLERRGKMFFPGLRLALQFGSHGKRMKIVQEQSGGGEDTGFDLTENLTDREPPFINVRANLSFLSGKYQQQHRPIIKQKKPAGHSVRWAYQNTAAVMYAKGAGKMDFLKRQEKLWERLVDRYMYVSGGIGSLPVIEGFGKPFELNNEFAYCETCAAIGSIFWNSELLNATGRVRYADLIEWQLYNAASVGISLDGISYFYRNPLETRGNLRRHEWFDTACCPSNISRLWGGLFSYAVREDMENIYIDQFVSCVVENEEKEMRIEMESGFPYDGAVALKVENRGNAERILNIRIPWWCEEYILTDDRGEILKGNRGLKTNVFGKDLFGRWDYVPVIVKGGEKKEIRAVFKEKVLFLEAHRRVKNNRNKCAVARGPLLYCMESCDNGSLELSVMGNKSEYRFLEDMMEGTGVLIIESEGGSSVQLVPYFLWGNREAGSMKVWLKCRRQ